MKLKLNNNMKKVMMENQLIHKKIHPFILEEKVLKNESKIKKKINNFNPQWI